ncbi:MAG TPA: DUF3810 family protein [Vicinamibacterales bacterium]|jgi:hypothetical protein|nr:DUF3810 family protein [Vicinamibacterales bacterium]
MTRLVLIAAAVVAAIAPTPPEWVERAYSTSAYIALQRRLTTLTNHIPISLLEVGALVVLVIYTSHVVGRWRSSRLAARGGRRAGMLAGVIVDTATVAAFVYLMFLALWGLNYRRASIATRFDHDRSRVTEDSVERLARFAASRLNALHRIAHARPWPALDALPASMGPAFETAQRAASLERRAIPGRPKWTLLKPYFVRAGIDGMTDPFFLEVLVNDAVLPFERHSIVAHEWAHLAGFAHEAEAGFVGWLTTMSGDEQAQYSGWLTVYAYAAGAVGDERQARLGFALEAGPTEDLRAIERRVSEAAPRVREVARVAYDQFLRANRVESGVRSYGELVTLIAGCRLDGEGKPVRGRPAAPKP